MLATSRNFEAATQAGLANQNLQRALGLARTGFPLRRRLAVERLPEFETLREIGRSIKDHTLQHLDFYLELYEAQVKASGGEVHWARTAEEACAAVLHICRSAGAKLVAKGKSMVAEEAGLNEALEANGITPVEADLGEYIIQLRHEPPSHIIAPAIHLVKEQVAETFRAEHRSLDPDRLLAEPREMCDEARSVLRPHFLAADVGITGANFLIAETGSSIIVTNEGNGDLTQTLPRIHIVMTSIEKLVPTFEDAATLLRLLARSATGQEFSSYTTISTGPRRAGDLDGPEQYHVILLDNGRSAMIGTEFQATMHPLFGMHEPLSGVCRGRRPCLWLGLSGADGRGIDAEPDRHRGSRTSAKRLDVLRALRERMPGQDPVAQDDAPLARARIRRKTEPGGLPQRPCSVGMGRAPSGALSRAYRDSRPGARLGRRPAWPLPHSASGGWLDRGARYAGAGGPQLSEPLDASAEEWSGPVSEARERILANVRNSLGRGRLDRNEEAELRARLAAHPRNPVPARATTIDERARIDLFIAMAEEVQSTVTRVNSLAAVPEAIARYLGAENLPAELVMAPDPSLDEIPWKTWPLLKIRRGRAEAEDRVSLTPCHAAIAETGTLMLISGAQTPTTLNFLPETHIVVVRRDQVVATYEDGWDRLRAGKTAEVIPRTVNFVTGPSRTADIEQHIELGAHGPRRLHIVLVEDGQAATSEGNEQHSGPAG